MKEIIENGFTFKAEDFIPYETICPICGSSDRMVEVSASKELDINWLKCNACLGVSSSHYVKEEVLTMYYNNYYNIQNDIHKKKSMAFSGFTKDNEACITFDDSDLFASHIRKYINISKKTVKILDYGGGGGAISYGVAERILADNQCESIEITIIDYEERTIESQIERISMRKISPDCFESVDVQFDIIIASAILEHIFFTGKLISRLFQLLGSGGYFYVRTPYQIPLYKLMLKLGIQIDTLFPEHVHDFSKRCFEKLPELLCKDKINIVVSQPSLFQNSFKKHFIKAVASRLIRLPYYVFSHKWPFVGGWEVVWQKY